MSQNVEVHDLWIMLVDERCVMVKVDSGDVGLTVDPTAGCMETLSLIVDEPQTKKSEVSPITRRRNEKTGSTLRIMHCDLAIS